MVRGQKVLLEGKFRTPDQERLCEMIRWRQGEVVFELDHAVHYVVTADVPTATLTKKIASLNAKGATIKVLEEAAFRDLIGASADEVESLIRAGARDTLCQALGAAAYFTSVDPQGQGVDRPVLRELILDGLDLSRFDFSGLIFEKCTFVGAKLNEAIFYRALDCDFSKAVGEKVEFGWINCSRFLQARLPKAKFVSFLAGSDFTAAMLEGSHFSESFWASGCLPPPAPTGPIFREANLRGACFNWVVVDAPVFDKADLTGAYFVSCKLKQSTFRQANLTEASLVAVRHADADFTGAVLRGTNLAEAELKGARFDGADLHGCNLRATTDGDFANAIAKEMICSGAVSAGPALVELNNLAEKAEFIKITFETERNGCRHEVEITSDGGHGPSKAYLWLPSLYRLVQPKAKAQQLSERLLQTGAIFGNYQVHFETVHLKTKQSPRSGKELKELVMQSISEAFDQPIPGKEALSAAATKHREEQHKLKEQAAIEAVKKREDVTRKIDQTVGKVTDLPTFLKALTLRLDKSKIDKATKMLKASKFQLYSDVGDSLMTGVVKSQTDEELVYACRIASDGKYACCTQNLNICGGLRGSVCKHLLVLIIGLMKAQKLDPTVIDEWLANGQETTPQLNKEAMFDIFLKYKGAEAGEIDWRPTETIPEDYYSF